MPCTHNCVAIVIDRLLDTTTDYRVYPHQYQQYKSTLVPLAHRKPLLEGLPLMSVHPTHRLIPKSLLATCAWRWLRTTFGIACSCISMLTKGLTARAKAKTKEKKNARPCKRQRLWKPIKRYTLMYSIVYNEDKSCRNGQAAKYCNHCFCKTCILLVIPSRYVITFTRHSDRLVCFLQGLNQSNFKFGDVPARIENYKGRVWLMQEFMMHVAVNAAYTEELEFMPDSFEEVQKMLPHLTSTARLAELCTACMKGGKPTCRVAHMHTTVVRCVGRPVRKGIPLSSSPNTPSHINLSGHNGRPFRKGPLSTYMFLLLCSWVLTSSMIAIA